MGSEGKEVIIVNNGKVSISGSTTPELITDIVIAIQYLGKRMKEIPMNRMSEAENIEFIIDAINYAFRNTIKTKI